MYRVMILVQQLCATTIRRPRARIGAVSAQLLEIA